MRLNFMTGVEFTFVPAEAPRQGKNFDSVRGAMATITETLLAMRGVQVNNVNTDPNVVEISTPPCTRWRDLAALYREYRTVADMLNLVPHHPTIGGGGGHIHQSGGKLDDPRNRLALYRLVTMHPEINWGFNAPEDTYNGSPMERGEGDLYDSQQRLLTRPLARMYRELRRAENPNTCPRRAPATILWQELEMISHKGQTINMITEYSTVEHRYFDAPRDLAEFKLHIRFAEALVKYAVRKAPVLLKSTKLSEYPIPSVLGQQLNPQKVTAKLLDFIDLIGLDSAAYRSLVGPNIRQRYEWDTVK